MKFRLLGPVEVIGDDGTALALSGDRERTLTCALVIGANRPVSAARLIDALWAEDPPATATNALQVYVSRLRKKLGAAGGTDRLTSTAGGYLLRLRPGETDIERFEQLVSRTHVDIGRELALIDEALEIWRGPAFSDVSSDLLRGEQARLEELHRLTVERRIDIKLALGQHDEVVGELESLVHAAPLQDGPRRRLMIALYRSGRQAESLAAYREGRELLAHELGLDPSPDLQALELAILRQDPELDQREDRIGPERDSGLRDSVSAIELSDGRLLAADSRTLTVLSTNIENAIRLRKQHPDAMRDSIAVHDKLLLRQIELARGRIFRTVGDAFCAVFDTAKEAVTAAIASQQELARTEFPDSINLRVRMAIHTGPCEQRDGEFFGPTVSRAAQLEGVAHGGQTLLSKASWSELQASAPEVGLVALGEHRLKDLGDPETIYQVVVPGSSDVFPPLRSLDDPVVRHNLPAQVSSFVGRVRELADLRDLVEENRLVTFCGPGGSGKTRLALQVAADFVDGTGDGVWFVDCSPLSSPELVAPTVATVLGISEEPDQSFEETISNELRDREMLVVLDNCEHLIDACAKWTDQILRSCPGVHMIATSREPLSIDGELIYRVPSLAQPSADLIDADKVLVYESVELFQNRAKLVQPDFMIDASNAGLIANLCRRLDGIPLAIELAAARLRTLSLAKVLEGLDDRFRFLTGGPRTALGRHRTLLALVDWSYELLNAPERETLLRLSVFSGGFSLAEVESVCIVSTGPFDATDLLTSLVDKSLVEFDPSANGRETRYRLLETIREYALSRLSESPGQAVQTARLAHACAFRDLVAAAANRYRESDQAAWMAKLAQEHDNLRSALEQFLVSDDRESALEMAVNLGLFWRHHGHYSEGIDYLERALGNFEVAGTELEVAGLLAEGALRIRRGDGKSVSDVLHRALAGARTLGLHSLAADSLAELAYFEGRVGEIDVALRMADESVELARLGGDSHIVAETLSVRANIFDRSELPGVRERWSEALEAARSAGDPRLTAVVLNNLAGRDMRDNDLVAARSHLEDALAIVSGQGYETLTSTALTNLGLVAVMQGDFEAAWPVYREALEVSHRIGSVSNTAYAMHGLGLCSTGTGDYTTAIVFHAVAETLFNRTGETLDDQEMDLRLRDLEIIREDFGASVFDEKYALGQSSSLDEAIRLVLAAESKRHGDADAARRNP